MRTTSRSPIITKGGSKHAAKRLPVHPGEILKEEFIDPMGITQYRLAKDIKVPPRRINEIVLGKRAITADTALRLGFYFDMNPGFWMNLQSRYDLDVERDRSEEEIRRQVDRFA